MFKLLTNLTDRRSWIVVLCAVVFAGVAGYYGGLPHDRRRLRRPGFGERRRRGAPLRGRRNWWSPRPLRWLHERIGLSENPQTVHAPVELGSPNRTMLGIQASGQPFDRKTGNNYAKEER